jgi:MFS family permease
MTRTKYTIAISIGLSVVASTLILPIFAPLIRELRLSVGQGGLMLSIGSIVMVVAAPVWGTVSDRYGRKAVVVVGFIGVFAGYVLFTLAVAAGLSGGLTVTSILVALTVSRALIGTFLSAVPSAAQALMADITSERERPGGMAIISGATGLGLIVGPAAGGLLVTGDITWPLYAAIGLCGLGAIIAAMFLRSTQLSITRRIKQASLLSTPLQPWLLAGILLWVAIATVQISAGFYFQDQLRLDSNTASRMLAIALTLVGAAMFAVQILQVRVLRLSPRTLILAGTCWWIAGLILLLSSAVAPLYYLAYAMLGLGAGFLLPGVMAGASLAVDHESQGVAAGLVSASQGIGFIIGPAVSTALYEWNRALPFWALICLMVLLMAKFAIVPLRIPQRSDAKGRL